MKTKPFPGLERPLRESQAFTQIKRGHTAGRPAAGGLITKTDHCRAKAQFMPGMVRVLAAGGLAAATALHSLAADAGAVLTGRFHVLWGDPSEECGGPPRMKYFLSDEKGEAGELRVAEDVLQAGRGILNLDRRMVEVTLKAEPVKAVIGVANIKLTSAEQAAGPISRLASGSQRYAWILCRFSDDPTTPEQPSWFQTQATGPYPSLDTFWREVSFNNIDLQGSDVFGWYDLPQPRSYYVYDSNGDGIDEADLQRLADDGTAVADADVYFPNYIGINLILNGRLDCCAWGGSHTMNKDGQNKTYGFTWMPPWGWRTESVLCHETGHSFGLPHSSGPYGETYDSQWDIMSNDRWPCNNRDPVYGCVGKHTISYHKDMLGWVASGHKYEVGLKTPQVTSLWVADLARVCPSWGFHLATVRSSSGNFYTIECRRWTGLDTNIPGPAVVIHDVDTGRARPAQVVDPDGNGDCNDAGAMWIPGETFTDIAAGTIVTVESANDDASLVTFSNAGRAPTYVDCANTGYQNGSPTYPWHTAWEGQGAVWPGGTVYIRAGTYPENITIRKSCVLSAWGTGNVVIGDN